jgi:CheY-like chemotaxis protein
MLSREDNERLTRVGPGTPAGEWLRRYWLPIAFSDRFDGMRVDLELDESFTFQGRTATTKEFGRGTGLGLSTVLGIVRNHGGAVSVYSELGRGTRIAIYLPVLDGATTAEESQPTTEIPNGAGEVVLLVDDEKAILTTTRMVLESANYRVLPANGGAEAVQAFRQNADVIRAVILDMMMPGMDGPTTMSALAEIDPDVRIIAVSGLQATGAVGSAVSARARAFLQKPYGDAQLLQTLRAVLQS